MTIQATPPLYSHAEQWELALSGRRVARAEARKLSTTAGLEEELVQEGYIGLLKAAQRFDPKRGVRFDTYARWWVRAQLSRFIDRTVRVVHVSSTAVEQARTLRKFRDMLEASGDTASAAKLSELTGIKPARVHQMLASPRSVSLETPRDGERYSVMDRLRDETASAEERLVAADTLRELRSVFMTALTDRQQVVLIRRFGLDDQPPGTLSEIGEEIGFSRESVRLIERAALDRLQTVIRSNTAIDTRQSIQH